MARSEIKSKPAPAKTPLSAVNRAHFPTWLFAILLAAVTITLYWPATRCDFVKCDDPDYVSNNPHVQGGLTWADVKWAFTNTQQGTQWAPIMWLSQELACQMFGLDPRGHHLVNVLLHAANTALVFVVFRRMTGALWRSLFLAAFFGWHPLRVESVAWVTERKDVLSTFFGLLAIGCYVWHAQSIVRGPQPAIRNPPSAPGFRPPAFLAYSLALLFFVLGLMSKAMLVTLPCVLLLLDYWPLGRIPQSAIRNPKLIKPLLMEKLPFFALAAAASVVTFLVQKHAGAVMTVGELPVGARIENALIACCRYLGKIFWPCNLAVYYPHPGYWPLPAVLAAGGSLCVIFALLFLVRRRYPFLLMGWLWFVGTLVPVIGLVQVGGQSIADRYTYFPCLGLQVLVIWGLYEMVQRRPFGIVASVLAGLTAIIFCLELTRQQIGYWTDSETLFRHALAVTKNNAIVTKALGDVLYKKGEPDAAMKEYQDALRIQPDDAEAHYNVGVVLFSQGRTDAALAQYQDAIRLNPDYADAHFNLGIALFARGQTRDAIGQFQAVVRLKPDDADARINLGDSLFNDGQTDAAIIQFQAALRLRPGDATAQGNLARALERKQKSVAPPSPQPNP